MGWTSISTPIITVTLKKHVRPLIGFVFHSQSTPSQTACQKLAYVHIKSHQLCQTLCNPMDHSLPAPSVHGILQTRILEWVAMPSSRGSSRPRDQTHVSYVSCIGRQVLYH